MTKEEFKLMVDDKNKSLRQPLGFGICKVDLGKNNKVLQATYPLLNWSGENLGSYAVFCSVAKNVISNSEFEVVYSVDSEFVSNALELFEPFIVDSINNKQSHKNIQVLLELKKQSNLDCKLSPFRFVIIYEDKKCESVESAYMKLLALSLGKAKLRSLCLEGIFGLLDNVAWSGNKPYELNYLRDNEIPLKVNGNYPVIDFVDKFPRYLMQVIPQYDNIRLLDSAKTRFGAYLGDGGYTQMPGASYVNFNSGVIGACMNEGRISSSVIIGRGTDIGGGASILGVLSGGNSTPITIGNNCLLGVNSATGISLGNGCIVDGGVAVLAGMVFYIELDEAKKLKEINPNFNIKDNNCYKGIELSGMNGIHFRSDSKTGKMIAFRSKVEIKLNDVLH